MTSTHGGGSVGRIVADANVILSAIIGKAALRVFADSPVDVATAEPILAEVREHLPALAVRRRIAPEALEGQLRLLPLRVYREESYRDRVPEATKRIGGRDPDDIGLLALALHLDVPVWTNDDDFLNTGVARFTTAELLRHLFGS